MSTEDRYRYNYITLVYKNILMKILNSMFFSKTSCSFPYHAVGMQFTAKETLGRTKYMRSICRVIYATRLKWKSNSGQILSYILEIVTVKWHFLKHIKRFFVKIERKYLRQSTCIIRRKKRTKSEINAKTIYKTLRWKLRYSATRTSPKTGSEVKCCTQHCVLDMPVVKATCTKFLLCSNH